MADNKNADDLDDLFESNDAGTLREDSLGADLRDVDEELSQEDTAGDIPDEEESSSGGSSGVAMYIVGGAAVLLVGALAITALMQDTETLAVPESNLGVKGEVIQSEQLSARKRWSETTGTEINRLGRDVNALAERTELIAKSQVEFEKNFKDELDESLAQFRNIMSTSLEQLQERDRKSSVAKERNRVVDQWSGKIADARVDLKAVYAQIRKEMKRLNASEDEIDAVYAQLLQEAGIFHIADVSEGDMTDEEVASLPANIRQYAKRIRDALYAHATTDGEILPQPGVYKTIQRMLTLDAGLSKVSQQDLENIYAVCRVRRDNLSEKLKAMVILLVAQQREEVPDRNLLRLEKMVWAQRELLHNMTPGQHLTLVHILGRKIDNATRGKTGVSPGFTKLDQRRRNQAEAIVDNAIEAAHGIHGLDSGKIQTAGRKALDNYVQTARIELAAADADAIINNRFAAFLSALAKRKAEKPAEPEVAVKDRAKRATGVVDSGKTKQPETRRNGGTVSIGSNDLLQDTGARLRLGSVEVDKRGARVAAWLLASLLERVYPGEPTDKKNVPAIVASWMQSARLSDTAFDGMPDGVDNGLGWGRAVIPQMMEVYDAGMTLIQFGDALGDGSAVDKPHYHLYRGTMIGREYGKRLHEGDAAIQDISAGIRKDYKDFDYNITYQNRIGAIERQEKDEKLLKPYTKILTAYSELGYAALPVRQPDLAWMMDNIGRMNEYATRLVGSLPNPSQWGSETTTFREKVEEGVRALLPMSMAARRDVLLTAGKETYWTTVEQDLLLYLVGLVSRDMAVSELNNTVLPMFVNAVSERNSGMQRLSNEVARSVPTRIQDLTKRLGTISPEKLQLTARTIKEEAMGPIQRDLAVEVIMSRVEPRIAEKTVTKGRVFANQVNNATKQYAQNLVKEPYTVANLDSWAIEATKFAEEMIDGGTRVAATEEPVAKAAPQAFPQPKMVQPYSGQKPAVDYSTESGINGPMRRITIPAASYANAHLISGVDAEIGGEEGEAVLVNMNQVLKGPAGSRLFMRNMRFIGEVEPSAGTERIKVDLLHLSYVFPSGHQVFVPVKGYVVDEQGHAGISGQLKMNLDRILPYAAASGFAGGFADTLSELSTSSVTTVGDGGGTVIDSGSNNSGDNISNALLAGIGDGISSVDSHIQGIMNEFRPSISVDIGRAITIVLTEPVAFDVPEREFKTLLDGQVGNGDL